MGSVWQRSVAGSLAATDLPDNWIYRLRTSAPYQAAKKSWKFAVGPGLSVLFFLYAGLMLINHLAYIVLDDAGFVCRESVLPVRMAKGETRRLLVRYIVVCSATGILLEDGGRYAITIKAREAHWYDRTIETSPAGFYSLDASTFWQKGCHGSRSSYATRVDQAMVSDRGTNGRRRRRRKLSRSGSEGPLNRRGAACNTGRRTLSLCERRGTRGARPRRSLLLQQRRYRGCHDNSSIAPSERASPFRCYGTSDKADCPARSHLCE